MQSQITIPDAEISQICHKYSIQRMMLFGSILGNTFSDDSDIDVLLEFEVNKTPSFLRFSAIQRELSHIFGRKVDLNTYNSLSRYFRDDVVKTAQVIYEKNV